MGKDIESDRLIISPIQCDWTTWTVVVTPPGRWNSHHNGSDDVAWVLPIQDTGLYIHQRTFTVKFTDNELKLEIHMVWHSILQTKTMYICQNKPSVNTKLRKLTVSYLRHKLLHKKCSSSDVLSPKRKAIETLQPEKWRAPFLTIILLSYTHESKVDLRISSLMLQISSWHTYQRSSSIIKYLYLLSVTTKLQQLQSNHHLYFSIALP